MQLEATFSFSIKGHMLDEMLKQLLKKTKQKERRPAFTLIELLLVIAIIAVLAGVVMGAINIPGFLGNAYDAERKHNVNQLENAMYQHLVDQWEMLNEVDIPEGEENAKDVCIHGLTDVQATAANCVKLDGLIPIFMAGLPTDPSEPNPNYTGYKVYKSAGRPRFVAAHLGELPVEGGGGGAGITVSAISGPTSEPNVAATFTVELDSEPTGDVYIDLESQDTTEGLVTSPTPITFNAGNWNIAQTVTVTGVDDAIADGPIVYTVNVDVDTVLTTAS